MSMRMRNFLGRAGLWMLRSPRRRKLTQTMARWTQNHIHSIRSGPGRGLKYDSGDIPFEILGLSERQVQGALNRHLKSGDVFWDVGAHAGFYAVLANRLVGPTGRTECFEPLPENIKLLERNLHANNRPAFVHPIALADEDGHGHLAIPRARTAQLAEEGIPVILARADSLDMAPPTVVKIDVEGAELRVLDGMKRILSQDKPVVIVECHDGLGPQVREVLTSYGYHVTALSQQAARRHLIATDGPSGS
jgi:FkbM family methyltransferase